MSGVGKSARIRPLRCASLFDRHRQALAGQLSAVSPEPTSLRVHIERLKRLVLRQGYFLPHMVSPEAQSFYPVVY